MSHNDCISIWKVGGGGSSRFRGGSGFVTILRKNLTFEISIDVADHVCLVIGLMLWHVTKLPLVANIGHFVAIQLRF